MKNIDKKRLTIFGVMLAGVVTVLLGITVAFFVPDFGQVKNEVATVQSGTLSLTFSDINETPNNINKTLTFGDTVEKELKIENTGTLDAYAKISWDNLTNTYLAQSLTYKLEYKASESEEWTSVHTSRRYVPRSDDTADLTLADSLLIPRGETILYKLTIKLENLPNIDQTQDLNATFTTKFTIAEGKIPSTSVMVARQNSTSTEKIWEHNADIKRVVFETEMNPKENATYTYDISEKEDGSVMAYVVPNEVENTKYDLYIQGERGVVANQNSSYLFYEFTSLESIEGLENFNTSKVTSLRSISSVCSNLATLNVSNFDTSKVTNMSNMFNGCSSLTTIDVSNFDTSNVTTMSSMFFGCSSLTSLNVSNFDTSKVANMGYMFYRCNNLTTLDVSNFDTSNVTAMNGMLWNCSELTTLDVSNFNTSNVTNMDSMFRDCRKLTTLNVSNFDTSNVTNMSWMFSGCSNLTSLDVSNFNTNNVTNMSYMFQSCSSLTSLDVSNFDTSNVTSMNFMFYIVPSTIKITVGNDELKMWIINASNSPKLTDSNFLIGA